ncbi:LuxR family transcriptional regulator [Pseudoprimorskyibacter insulae]|uniref:Transcriptional activator protein AnoR n=1 Tax=Pseudoprimorskyibacter insulae TaxID=1695997 RepID=A0A2R8AZK3_9RHOB|nr:LuxR family transcriptional regulator [Pseudoprimorskyibacter insulae]SPF81269.1 Transcriptional activator protein AnoR [Pseudoprimorskyibacter insulae]
MLSNDVELLLNLTNAASIETLWSNHCERMAGYGFDRLIFGFTRFRGETSLGDPNDFLILSNHDKAYLDRFIGDEHYRTAPMVRWALENDGAVGWSVMAEMLAKGEMSEAEQRVVALNQEMGVTAGYTISFRSVSKRTKGAIALTAKPGMTQAEADEIWREHGEVIVLMNNIIYLKVLTLPYTPPNQSLTKRQREALEWVGDGKTMQDIAAIMGLTQATIEKHLRLAREALNVETTAQAVMKAAFQNQMFVVES